MLRHFELASPFISVLDDTEQSIPQLKIQISGILRRVGFVHSSSGCGYTLCFENYNNLTVTTVRSFETSATSPFDTV